MLVQKARQPQGLPVLLFDSGHRVVHRAVCREIRWDSGGERIPTPDSEKTPVYYRSEKYLAWFRLDTFEDAPLEPSDLKAYSYVRVDAFFDDWKSRYTQFYGRRSRQELRQQDRTIWFIRQAQPEDPSHKISLTRSPFNRLTTPRSLSPAPGMPSCGFQTRISRTTTIGFRLRTMGTFRRRRWHSGSNRCCERSVRRTRWPSPYRRSDLALCSEEYALVQEFVPILV